jgi:hypothetical protein
LNVDLGLSHGDAHVLISLNHLDLIADPLDDGLMKSRWDTLIGVYPISPKQHIVAPLDIHHEEGYRNSFAPNR